MKHKDDNDAEVRHTARDVLTSWEERAFIATAAEARVDIINNY